MPSRDSAVPLLPIFEGLKPFGEIRLVPKNLENQIHVEIRRHEQEWKPFLALAAVDGKIAFRLFAEKGVKDVVYDFATNTFQDLVRSPGVRDSSGVRTSEAGKDDDSRKDTP